MFWPRRLLMTATPLHCSFGRKCRPTAINDSSVSLILHHCPPRHVRINPMIATRLAPQRVQWPMPTSEAMIQSLFSVFDSVSMRAWLGLHTELCSALVGEITYRVSDDVTRKLMESPQAGATWVTHPSRIGAPKPRRRYESRREERSRPAWVSSHTLARSLIESASTSSSRHDQR